MTNNNTWQVKLPFQAIATPRPQMHVIKGKVTTFYPGKYESYRVAVRNYLWHKHLYNKKLRDIMLNPYGVKATIIFHLHYPSKKYVSTLRTSAPDIDNLVKGVFDAIFFKQFTDPKTQQTYHGLQTEQGKEIRDSRIVAIKAIKLKDPQKSHIHVTFQAL